MVNEMKLLNSKMGCGKGCVGNRGGKNANGEILNP